jgi:2-isopropylmalate synthase
MAAPIRTGADLLARAAEFGVRDLSERARAELLDRIRHMQRQGYDLSGVDGTLELIFREAVHPEARPFDVLAFEVSTRMTHPHPCQSEASVSVKVRDAVFAASATCDGPVNALDTALRKCLAPLYPSVLDPRLVNYRLGVLDMEKGTAAHAAVTMEWSDGQRSWSTMGVSDNIIEATWIAITTGVKLQLMRLGEENHDVLGIQDSSWAV